MSHDWTNPRTAAALCCAAAGTWVCLVGGLVLLGWTLHVEPLMSIGPGVITMKVNTAVAFVLAGVVLLLSRTESADRRKQGVGQACAVTVALIGALTLSEYLFGWDLGIDQLLFSEPLAAAGATEPGRMSPQSAASFLAFGVALLALDTRHGEWIAQPLALATGLWGLVALTGYAYHVTALYVVGPYIGIAFHTALSFVILSIGVLCARPARGLMMFVVSDTAGGVMLRRLLPVVVFTPIVLGWLIETRYSTFFTSSASVHAVALVVVFGALTLWTARSLHRSDTERQRAQEQLRQLNTELDERVQARTADLAAAVTSLREEVAERQRLEEELRQSEQRFRTISASAQDAIVLIDDQGRAVFWNRAAETIFGYSAAEMLGKDVHRIVAPERFAAAYTAGLREFAQTGTGNAIGQTLELAALRKDGTEFPVELSVAAMQLGGHWHAVGITRDITERKLAQAELERARDAAHLASRAKSEFLANMSHEIRTPLNAVVGLTSLLLETPLTPEQYEFVQTVRASGDALLGIINDILDFSKIEAGKLDLEARPFSIRQCVEEAIDLVAPQAAQKSLDLAYEVEDSVPAVVNGDGTRLRQILVNLAGNAVKFTAAGEVVVSVSATMDNGRGCEVHFSVRDTGVGIPAERMDRLFRAFSQVDASTTRRFGGTGLGLVISRRLVEMMHGRMWVESTEGAGSVFHFTICTTAVPQVQGEPSVPPATLEGRRVLIVDDNATNRQILLRQVERWGMRAQAAGAGAEALEWVRCGEPFDVALLDMQMPVMDGATLAMELRRLRDARALPLIMLSSMGRREPTVPEATEAAELFAAFLTKPVKPALLHDVLVGVLCPDALPERQRRTPEIDRELARRLPLRILVAEDNVVNQRVAVRVLERMGYRADVAANGAEVVEALTRQHYDVVFMDVHMPEMDGLEATREICRRWPAADRPRIVAMTADALTGDREKCLAAGMDDYISKPVHPSELQAALQRGAKQGQADVIPPCLDEPAGEAR